MGAWVGDHAAVATADHVTARNGVLVCDVEPPCRHHTLLVSAAPLLVPSTAATAAACRLLPMVHPPTHPCLPPSLSMLGSYKWPIGATSSTRELPLIYVMNFPWGKYFVSPRQWRREVRVGGVNTA